MGNARALGASNDDARCRFDESASGRARRRFAFLYRTRFGGVPIPPMEVEIAAWT
jgi:hypothetical protein